MRPVFQQLRLRSGAGQSPACALTPGGAGVSIGNVRDSSAVAPVFHKGPNTSEALLLMQAVIKHLIRRIVRAVPLSLPEAKALERWRRGWEAYRKLGLTGRRCKIPFLVHQLKLC